MKKILYLIVFVFSINSYALNDSAVISTDNNKNTVLLKENSKNISNLKTKYSNLDVILDKYDTCSDKNLLYVGNVDNTDADGCLDVQVSFNTDNKPTFAGFTNSSDYDGALLRMSENYNVGDTTESWARPRADWICRNHYANSRAMTADDLKYTYSSLSSQISGGNFLGPGGTKIWLFDANLAIISSGSASLLSKYPSSVMESSGDCRSHTVSSQFNNGAVLGIGSYSSNYYLQLDVSSCDSRHALACVYN